MRLGAPAEITVVQPGQGSSTHREPPTLCAARTVTSELCAPSAQYAGFPR